MRHRVRSKHPSFRQYRGVRVCERWLSSFENFLADMGPRPSPRHSLDRFPDWEGDYEPGNCRWATRAEQNSNRRDTVRIEIGGERMTLRQAEALCGVKANTLWRRLRAGWSVERAVSLPARTSAGRRVPSNARLITMRGETLTLSEWARRNGIAPLTALQRVRRGWDLVGAVTVPSR
jgi:hypothetical protein